MKKIVIAGGSGFLGKILTKYFRPLGYQVVVLSRSPQQSWEDAPVVTWDGTHVGIWAKELEGAEVLINLAGKSVNCRYTPENKDEIYRSRLAATHALAEAIRFCENPPPLWINAASATIYRHAEDRPMDEYDGEIGEGFSVDVCQKWEEAFFSEEVPSTRKVALRIAIVLGNGDGALDRLVNLAKVGIGGPQGSGKQRFSWLHAQDFARLVMFLMAKQDLSGVFNAAAPHPVTNRELMEAIRRKVGMPLAIPLPAWLLRIGAWLIGTETELILKSRWVVPTRLQESGFAFSFPEIDMALGEILGNEKQLQFA